MLHTEHKTTKTTREDFNPDPPDYTGRIVSVSWRNHKDRTRTIYGLVTECGNHILSVTSVISDGPIKYPGLTTIRRDSITDVKVFEEAS